MKDEPSNWLILGYLLCLVSYPNILLFRPLILTSSSFFST